VSECRSSAKAPYGCIVENKSQTTLSQRFNYLSCTIGIFFLLLLLHCLNVNKEAQAQQTETT